MVRDLAEGRHPNTSQETLGKVIEVLLEALDPTRLSLDSFDLAAYFDSLLKSIGKKFGMSRIILRYEDRVDKNKLNALATFGFDKQQVRTLTSVTKENSMAQYLARIGSCYYAANLFGPDTKFDQTQFAKKLNLKSSFSCPLFFRDTFVGFIIYYKTEHDGFNSDERDFLGKLNDIIQRIFVFAESISQSSDQFIGLSRDYSSALASLLISFHDAKNYLALGSEMIENAKKWTEGAQVIPELNKRKTLIYLDFALNRNTQAKQLVLETLRGQERRFAEIKNLRGLIEEAVAPIRSQLRGIQLNMNANTLQPITVIGNKRQLRQVFFNIIYNAYRATSEAIEQNGLRTQGVIDVLLRQDARHVYIDITDNGIGIQPDRLETIFSERTSTWKNRTGSGIGLNLCKKIIGFHCGKISIDSKYLEGTTVHIDLPKNLKQN